MIVFLTVLGLISSDQRRDFYKILEVPHDATDKQIKRSYMKLSKKFHPDKNKDPKAADYFTDINDAYQTLINPNKRRIFDLYGEPGVHMFEAPSTENSEDPVLTLTKSDSADSSSKIVRNRGDTVKITYPVDLEDFYTGRMVELNLTRTNMCRCPHTGYYCNKCHGKATQHENMIVKTYLEKGFEEGHVTTLQYLGDVTEMNGPGDIEVKYVSKRHPLYTRKGDDLLVTINITLREALLGFNKTIKGIDGNDLIIETDKPFNNHIIIPERGLPKYMYPGMFGDVIVQANIRWPKSLTNDQIKELGKLTKP